MKRSLIKCLIVQNYLINCVCIYLLMNVCWMYVACCSSYVFNSKHTFGVIVCVTTNTTTLVQGKGAGRPCYGSSGQSRWFVLTNRAADGCLFDFAPGIFTGNWDWKSYAGVCPDSRTESTSFSHICTNVSMLFILFGFQKALFPVTKLEV